MKRLVFAIPLVLALLAPLDLSAQVPNPKPADERCIIPDQAVIDWISLGLYPEDGTYLRHVWAVKSDDFENVWFLAADIQGPDMDRNDEVAVWATNALTKDGKPQPTGGGAVFSIDAFAQEFSDWPHGNVQDLSREDDGYKSARKCAEAKEQLEPTPAF